MAGDRMDILEYENTRLADYTAGGSDERGGVDIPFLVLTLVLLTVGVIMVLSSSYVRAYYNTDGQTNSVATFYFLRQGMFALIGVAFMAIISKLPVSLFKKASLPILLASGALLIGVLLIGSSAGGAKRWFSLGPLTFQPSELAKVAVILFYPAIICKNKNKMNTFRFGILPFVLITAVLCFLLILEPHYSATAIIVLLTLILMFVGGVSLWWYIIGGIAVVGVAIVVYTTVPYVQNRITAWLNPFDDASDTGWQVVQSLYAIGSGGFLGLGLGNSRQKFLYLPEEHNDYIFSIVGEELGFVGAALIVILFTLLVLRGLWIARHARDRYSFLVAVGISSLFLLQFAMNIAVCTNVMPSTGISLPLFSYGGTALLIQMAEIGVMLSISRDIRKDGRRRR